ncbi:MAG: biotin carboxylase N-terminal domain-containing protein [Pseudomonadota bacterium]
MFEKILIANRGEIAIRVARTARRMGIQTVAVYSEADNGAPHMRYCDEAVFIGAAPPSQSYLVIDKIIDAARKTGAQAVHPGYGFLSENAEFADALDAAGIVFIGPTAETIRSMGSKSAAKDLMEAAKVPTTPGYQGKAQTLKTFERECERIGYPVLLKATAGGGGKGMRVVNTESELSDALDAAKREAKSAFGDDRFLVEKYVARARHLEVQVFGDGQGDVVHMFERDCSVQRRHQKVMEEAPAPALPADVRASLLKAGVDAAKAVNYRGAGTVEFLFDPAAGVNGIYFMEMNTRLQVEHPVSEEITGLDFVEWQLRIAAGEGLPLSQDEVTESGHAFEARLYAENPENDFAPSIGDISALRLPGDVARIDSGIVEGQTITPHYDPMISKIITHGGDRTIALNKMRAALTRTRVAGLDTNGRFLHALARDTDFKKGEVSTRYIEENTATLFDRPSTDARIFAAASLYQLQATRPLMGLQGFRLNSDAETVSWAEIDGELVLLRLASTGPNAWTLSVETGADAKIRRAADNDTEHTTKLSCAFTLDETDGTRWRITLDDSQTNLDVLPHGSDGDVRVWIGADVWHVRYPDVLVAASDGETGAGGLSATLPGLIVELKTEIGAAVKKGDPLLVMEAMKMEHTVSAPADGTVEGFRFMPGDQVKDGDLLVDFVEA